MFSTALPTLLVASATVAHAYWQPEPGATWQIVLANPLQPPFPTVEVLDGDLFDTTAATWSSIKSAGYNAICYFSAGTYEEWRADAGEFNSTDLGANLDDWPGERWLNTNSANVRRIMQERMDLAISRGCSAIDPDNLDAYDNDGGGLGLTEDDAVNYVQFLSDQGHKRGLAVGLKNAGAIVDRVLPLVDFQVNEQCQQFGECSDFRGFIDNNKPVFNIEYVVGTPNQTTIDSICNNPSAAGFSSIIKHMVLDEWAVYCS